MVVMEFVWMAVFILALAASVTALLRGQTKDLIIFALIAVSAASMYYFRQKQRKNS
jgi:hypothetical protein